MIGFCEGGARCDPHPLKNDISKGVCLMAFHLKFHFPPGGGGFKGHFCYFVASPFQMVYGVTDVHRSSCSQVWQPNPWFCQQSLILSGVLKCRHVQLCFETSFQYLSVNHVYFNPSWEQFFWGTLQKCERVLQNDTYAPCKVSTSPKWCFTVWF